MTDTYLQTLWRTSPQQGGLTGALAGTEDGTLRVRELGHVSAELADWLVRTHSIEEVAAGVARQIPNKEGQLVLARKNSSRIWGGLLTNPQLDTEVAEYLYTKIAKIWNRTGKLPKATRGKILLSAVNSGAKTSEMPGPALYQDLRSWGKHYQLKALLLRKDQVQHIQELTAINDEMIHTESGPEGQKTRTYRRWSRSWLTSVAGMAVLDDEAVKSLIFQGTGTSIQTLAYPLARMLVRYQNNQVTAEETIDALETFLQVPVSSWKEPNAARLASWLLANTGAGTRVQVADNVEYRNIRKVVKNVDDKLSHEIEKRLQADKTKRDSDLGMAARAWGITTLAGKANSWESNVINPTNTDATILEWLQKAGQPVLHENATSWLSSQRNWPDIDIVPWATPNGLRMLAPGPATSVAVLSRVLAWSPETMYAEAVAEHGVWLTTHGVPSEYGLAERILESDVRGLNQLDRHRTFRFLRDKVATMCSTALTSENLWIEFTKLAENWQGSLGELLIILTGKSWKAEDFEKQDSCDTR